MTPSSPLHIIKRAKAVYGAPREPPIQTINQDQSEQLEQSEQSNPTSPLPFSNRKSLHDQLAEIDNLDDDQLPPIPSSQGEVQLSPTVSTTHDQTGSTTNRSSSAQSNFTTQPPTSISKSITALTGSPSSHGPFTPPDLSPTLLRPPVEKEQQSARNKLRISDSDDEDEEDQLLTETNTKALSPLKTLDPQRLDDDDFLPEFDPTYIDEEEKQRAIAEAEASLPVECDTPGEEESTENQSGKRRLVSGSDSEAETPKNKKLKTKKAKGLNKRAKEEMDRHLAALTRKKDLKLVGACKQPSTSLDAIFSKLAQPNKKTSNNQSLPIEPIQVSSKKASTSSPEIIEKTDGPVPEEDDDDLPGLDQVFAEPLKLFPRTSNKLQLLETRKKELLAKQTEPTEEHPKKNDKKGKSKEEDVVDDNSDSDLEVVDFPSKNTLTSRAPTALKRVRSAIKPVVSRSSLRLSTHQAGPGRSVSAKTSDRRTDQNLTFMDDLKTRSALDSARERKRKEQEFIEHAGSTALLKLASVSKKPVAAVELNIKDILKKDDDDVEMNEKDDEDEDDEDWNGDHDDEEGDELGSGSEVGSVEEEAQEEEAEEEEDNMEEDMPSGGQVVHNMDIDDELLFEATKRRQLRVIESPQPDAMSLQSPTPIDLTGFRAVSSRPQELIANTHDLDDNPSPLPGFEDDEDCLPGFGRSTITTSKLKPTAGQSQTNFTQLFEAEGSISQPPIGLLKQNKANGISEENEDGFAPTCVLPEVNVLPEERERDMMIMMLGGQKNEALGDSEPAQYINDRGLLTQNKPSHGQLPPDSPLFSQDLVAARTPFALRKESVIEGSPSLPRVIERHGDDREGSPITTSGVQRKVSRIVLADDDDDEAEEQEEQEEMSEGKPVDAFALLMTRRTVETETVVQESAQVKKSKKLNLKNFMADQADESDEEGAFGVNTGGGSDSESDGDSEAARSIYEALVDDEEDERDETTKLEGEEALEELLKLQQKQSEEKQQREIQKVIEGKLRKKQAGLHGGGISDSDSEDDDEIENVKAQQRFQEQLKKKKKRAIHELGKKHESFYKSYEETTMVDDDDVSFLQNQEEEEQGSEDEDEDGEDEGDEEIRIERKSVMAQSTVSIREVELLAIERSRKQEEEYEYNEEEIEIKEEYRFEKDSSPIELMGINMKINDPLSKTRITNHLEFKHSDIDGYYNTKKINKLSDRQMGLKVDMGREDRNTIGPSKSSSITYQQQIGKKLNQEKINKEKEKGNQLERNSNHRKNKEEKIGGGANSAIVEGSSLAKLKNKKSSFGKY